MIINEGKRAFGDKELGIICFINIVFLLLIFFVISGHIENLEEVPVSPPVSQVADEKIQTGVDIVVDQWGRVFIEGEPKSFDELNKVARYLNRSGVKVSLKVDGTLKNGIFNEVVFHLNKAGYSNVAVVVVN